MEIDKELMILFPELPDHFNNNNLNKIFNGNFTLLHETDNNLIMFAFVPPFINISEPPAYSCSVSGMSDSPAARIIYYRYLKIVKIHQKYKTIDLLIIAPKARKKWII